MLSLMWVIQQALEKCLPSLECFFGAASLDSHVRRTLLNVLVFPLT